MLEDRRNIYRAIRAQAIAKYLERIGDHATNLAEMVIFMVVGKDVRHVGSMAEMSGHRMPRGMLFLGARNSARSQIAEGWARHLFPAGVSVCSAGAEPATALNPHALRVMQEVGVDISNQKPKPVGDVPIGDIDTVITVCAEDACALPPGGLVQHHWALDDPPVTATKTKCCGFSHAREEIRRRLGGARGRVRESVLRGLRREAAPANRRRGRLRREPRFPLFVIKRVNFGDAEVTISLAHVKLWHWSTTPGRRERCVSVSIFSVSPATATVLSAELGWRKAALVVERRAHARDCDSCDTRTEAVHVMGCAHRWRGFVTPDLLRPRFR